MWDAHDSYEYLIIPSSINMFVSNVYQMYATLQHVPLNDHAPKSESEI